MNNIEEIKANISLTFRSLRQLVGGIQSSPDNTSEVVRRANGAQEKINRLELFVEDLKKELLYLQVTKKK